LGWTVGRNVGIGDAISTYWVPDDCQIAWNCGSDAISMIFTTAQVAPINLA